MLKQVQESKQGQFRYIVDDFKGKGQDSFTSPPAQDDEMFERLTNVMPIIQKGIQRRWGYAVLNSSLTGTVDRLASFQRDLDGLRTIIASGPNAVQAVLESGLSYNDTIFAPLGGSPRSLTSRSFAYFFTGDSRDLKKWDGSVSGGTSKWGIELVSTTISADATGAPNTATTVVWSSPNNAKVEDGAFATVTVSNTDPLKTLNLTNFGLLIPPGATIRGINVSVKGFVAGSGGIARLGLQPLKAGIGYGELKFISLPLVNGFASTNLTNDLWGGVWTSVDVTDTDFGIQLQPLVATFGGAASSTFSVDYVTITITYDAASSAPVVTSVASSGDIDLTIGRIYFIAFKNSTTLHIGDLSAASASTGPISGKSVSLDDLAVSDDPQADVKLLLATADGGDPSSLYLVAELPMAQTIYQDNTIEEVLVLQQLYQFTDDLGNDFGIADNTPPPPDLRYAIKHVGRVWGLAGQLLYFSKSTSELTLPNGFIAGKYEEAWPADNFFDISEGAETGRGLFTDGQTIYIGTERSILRVTGDDPTNFSQPEIVHSEVGLLNQDVWQTVFVEGTPAGAMWLTPDFRCIFSDLNSYTDVGTDIQDVLDRINPAATDAVRAMFVSKGPYDLYLLGLPLDNSILANTICVYDMRSKQWFVWELSHLVRAMLFNIDATGFPQWLFASQLIVNGDELFGALLQFDETSIQDINITPAVTVRTSWLDLQNSAAFKLLDEVEPLVDDISETFLTIEAADRLNDFDTPIMVVASKPFRAGPFRTYKAYLSTLRTHHKYFRFTFFSPQNGLTTLPADFLNGYLIRYQLVNTL